MQVEPGYEDFESRYKSGASQVIWTRLVADLMTPVYAFLNTGSERPYAFLFESVEGGAVRGRYSIIGRDPDLIWRANGDKAQICHEPTAQTLEFEDCPEPTLAALRKLTNSSRIDIPEELPPMSAGVFGYMGYDTVRLIEELPDGKTHPLDLADATFIRPTVMAIFDAVKDEIIVVAPVRPKAGLSAKEAYNAAVKSIEHFCEDLNQPVTQSQQLNHHLPVAQEPVSNTSAEQYEQMVLKAKDYIAAGDIFQVVLSQQFSAEFTLPPFALYRSLRRTNPAPFLFFLNFDDFSIVGSSPEILVRARDDEITVRPIAGTRPRGQTSVEDKAYADELLADPKELAEHLMLLDLGRNDVGRVSQIGTVQVTDSFFLEYYSHVMHIVSNVVGKLDPSKDAIDALLAGFPAGTVSGAPKVRAMEIIDELEVAGRGIYAGCVGYFSASGEMDSCITLRTAVVKDNRMYVQAGAGIVADSIPANEQNECVYKARALFRAADDAIRFASQGPRI